MRRTLLVPLMVVLFGALSWEPSGRTVSAQVGTFLAPVEPATQTSASVDEMIARVLSFDHDGDGAVGGDELVDRMQPLLARGDRDGNGRLDRAEIRALASAPPRTKNTFPFASHGYGFGDEIGISSRSHVEGALEDLRLDDEAHARALQVVSAFMDAVEAKAADTLMDDLEPLVTSQQAAQVRAIVAPGSEGRPTVSIPGVAGNRVIRFNGTLEQLVEQFRLSPEPRETARAAVARYRETIRPGEAERPVLLASLQGLLDDDQRENFGAALARRPVVSRGGAVFVPVGAKIQVLERMRILQSTGRRVQTDADGTLIDVPAPSATSGR